MGRRKLTRVLLESGCDQRVTNKQGETARQIADRKGLKEVVDILDNPPKVIVVSSVDEVDRYGEKPPYIDIVFFFRIMKLRRNSTYMHFILIWFVHRYISLIGECIKYTHVCSSNFLS